MQKGWYATRLLIYWSYSLTRPQLTMNLSWWTLDYSSATHASQTLRWKGKGKGHLTSMSLGPIVPTYKHHETFSFMMSLPAINVLCFSRKGGIGGGGWVYQKCAKSTATSGLISRNDLVATERDNRNQRNQGTNNSWETEPRGARKTRYHGLRACFSERASLCSVKEGLCVQWSCAQLLLAHGHCWPAMLKQSLTDTLSLTVIQCTSCLSTRAHDDIIVIVAEEEECVMVRISKQTESPMCTKHTTCGQQRFVLSCSNWLIGSWSFQGSRGEMYLDRMVFDPYRHEELCFTLLHKFDSPSHGQDQQGRWRCREMVGYCLVHKDLDQVVRGTYVHVPNWHPRKNVNIHSLHCLLTCDGLDSISWNISSGILLKTCDKIQ